MGEINYTEIAERAVAYAKANNIDLDYSERSIEEVDSILEAYYEHLAEYDGQEGADTLWNIAVHFGIYLGETMLRLQLADKGFEWHRAEDDGMLILKNDSNMQISPITKAHKRILYGPEDSVKSFWDVTKSIVNDEFPTKNVLRGIDVELASGQQIENVLHRDIDSYIMLVAEGQEDFIILNSHDGFLQFYGVGDQFVAELRVNLPKGDFHTYSIIDKNKKNLTNRIVLSTPYGQYTPLERDVVSLEQIKETVEKYYRTMDEESFLKEIPYVDTTEETKRYMSK